MTTPRKIHTTFQAYATVLTCHWSSDTDWCDFQLKVLFQVEESWKMVPGELYFMIKISTLTFLSKEEGEKQA